MSEVKTVRPGKEWWDRLCAIPRYGFVHSPDNKRVLKMEGIGTWIDMHAAQEVVDGAQDDLNAALAREAALQVRLNVADQRVDDLGSALKHLVHNVKATGKRLDLGLAMEVAEQTLKGGDV
jgi:hypothetical protein